MNVFTGKDLKQIARPQKTPCLSVFMPTERVGKRIQQNAIRFKNRLSEAKRQLEKRGFREIDIRDMLGPAQKLLNDNQFWRYQSSGLAVFINPELFLYYRLPLEFDEMVVVANQFHIKPLLTMLSGDGTFYILALSQNMVKFFQATRDTIHEVEIDGLPRNMDDALGYDNLEKQVQFHTGTPKRKGKREAMFHGHGAAADIPQEFLLRYFRKVSRALHPVLKEERAPLCLAAVEYLIPLYKDASSYSHVLDKGIGGNPENLRPEELHKKAWDIAGPLFLQEQNKAAQTYLDLAETEKASNLLQEVVPASFHGRAAVLFVAVGVQKWGTFDPGSNKLAVHSKKRIHDVDLLDFAAVHTLLNGGTVYAVKPDDVPGGSSMAAVYRY